VIAIRWPLLRLPGRKRKPAYVPSPGQLRAALQRVPHPFALGDASLRCACGLGAASEVHDWDSLVDARAVLNGTGGAREQTVREMAARMHEEAGDD
jgi:hypothetical protein